MANEAIDVIALNDGLSNPKNWPQDRRSMIEYISSKAKMSMPAASQYKKLFPEAALDCAKDALLRATQGSQDDACDARCVDVARSSVPSRARALGARGI